MQAEMQEGSTLSSNWRPKCLFMFQFRSMIWDVEDLDSVLPHQISMTNVCAPMGASCPCISQTQVCDLVIEIFQGGSGWIDLMLELSWL